MSTSLSRLEATGARRTISSSRDKGTTLLIDSILFWGLVVLVGLAPMPLASNRPLPAAILALLAGLLLAAWGLRAALSPGGIAVAPRRVVWSLLTFGIACLWIAFQAAPFVPGGLADPIWHAASGALATELDAHLSVNPEQTLSALMHLLSYAAIFWLSLQMTRRPERAKQALAALVTIGAVYAVYGVVEFLTGSETILFYRKWSYLGVVTSTFVNRNSYATFAGLVLLCAVALLTNRTRHWTRAEHPLHLRLVYVGEQLLTRDVVLTFSFFTIAASLVLSASRGGTGASFAAIFVFLLLPTSERRGGRGRRLSAALLVMALLLLVFAVSSARLQQRTDADALGDGIEGRSAVWSLTLDAIETAPLRGTGFGTFADVFPAYRSTDLSVRAFWDKAHDTYLENALELGLPAMISLQLSIALLAARCAKGVSRRRKDRHFAAIGLAATVLVGLHSIVDFSLQIPAVSVLYAFMMGLAVSQSFPTRD